MWCLGRLAMSLVALLCLVSCSTTKHIPDDDHLFVGLTDINYKDYERNQNFISTQEEIEAALATAPNGALFGSSYHRTPFPYGLWIWNAFSGKESDFAKWMTKSFGKQPVLMSWVNPALRASVAQSVLRSHGYFHGKVDYEIVQQKNPKKQKIGYTVTMGDLFTVDSISYVGFPEETDSLLAETEPSLKPGDPLTVAALDAERNRLTTTFRNNGYFYYQTGYASYLADTIAKPGKANLRLQLVDDLPEQAMKKWTIGNVTIDVRKQFMQQLTDSIGRRRFKVRYAGRKVPVRLSVIMNSMKLRHGTTYSYNNYIESISKLNSTGIFSMVDFTFTPRTDLLNPDSTRAQLGDTLDLNLNCVLEKPYDTYLEANVQNKTSGRFGPELRLGLTKRNAFRGGELLDINLHGSYEWQRSKRSDGGTERLNSYEYGVDVSLEFPRVMLPWREWMRQRRLAKRRRQAATMPTDSASIARRRHRMSRMTYYTTPSTLAKVSRTTLNRPDFFKMVNFSAEWTYRWQKTQTSRHEMSPLTITYQHLVRTTIDFDSILTSNPYLSATMRNVFIPKMRYTYQYASPSTMGNPIRWEITLSESGNLSALAFMAGGRKWNEKDKEMFKNPFSQFLKVETDFTKTWRLTNTSQLVGHLNAGVIYSYGNSTVTPFSESFYVGGANSIRAFTVRGLGPGCYAGAGDAQYSYLIQNGDIKLQGNLEYRTRLFGDLQGAVFLDMGNVWKIGHEESNEYIGDDSADMNFHFKDFLSQMAVGTGVGLRYDLDFLVLRLDWGIGLHVPFTTSKSGFFNIPRFRDSQALHLAVGYPF
ncbi:MAG: BamA/TamA family outer membrane protein [Prevotella sp.]|nr:BamA/TamA family outer membrane protein [Prevotella sp.]